ncbi:hypothetical protein [Levilactobacillus acidifarinae]|uniref:Antitoxin n=1 Tax=Levilactobacillus acidifarinae DSM 19394 = JCM 15949 TaxID=1423715 RepID=A0A0R1LLN7_9LACO|nr:hypothetical protein [Levilactobacillus acidifarinae]KRK94435.1 hypothetical protein FD25_GL000397 [Levilactobacillus acidifarinae DSM 19394]GEO68178.1 hypothetical protein LAC03_00880 [Levilactobacillus acidifarinae]
MTTKLTAKPASFAQMARQVTVTHHPVMVHQANADVVVISKRDFETAQAIITAALGQCTPFMTPQHEA